MMYSFIDLRYAVPLVINLILFQVNPQAKIWDQDDATLKMPILLVAIVLISLFLFTSIKLPLSVSLATQPIRLRAGDFSGAVAISLLASFIFPPPLFWAVYTLIICVSPWHGLILNLFNHFLCFLQAIPSLIIICFTQQQESPEPESEPPQLGNDVALDAEGLPMQDPLSLDHDSVLVIDGQL